jgi:hypothetical protein
VVLRAPTTTPRGRLRRRLRLILTKTKQPEHHRDWTTRDRAGNVRLYRLAAEVLGAVEAGVFPPRVGWHCQDCPVRSRCWAWGLSVPCPLPMLAVPARVGS